MISGDSQPVAGALLGGADPRKRLAIHHRHYETSLTGAIREKFPATAWLVGADLVTTAARAYARAHPPRQPCIAEYGGDFPSFLARHDDRASALPYLESFAELEWAVGQVSIAVDVPPLAWPDVARLGTHVLLDSGVAIQSGARYLRSSWGVDGLMRTYLSDAHVEGFVLGEAETFVEVRGSRGELSMRRLKPGTFGFRASLCAGHSIADAAAAALECDETFDAGEGLRMLVEAALATRICVVPGTVST